MLDTRLVQPQTWQDVRNRDCDPYINLGYEACARRASRHGRPISRAVAPLDWPFDSRRGIGHLARATTRISRERTGPWPAPDPRSAARRLVRRTVPSHGGDVFCDSVPDFVPHLALCFALGELEECHDRTLSKGSQSNHSSAGSNFGNTITNTFILPMARCRTPGGMRMQRPGSSGTRLSSNCISASGWHSRI